MARFASLCPMGTMAMRAMRELLAKRARAARNTRPHRTGWWGTATTTDRPRSRQPSKTPIPSCGASAPARRLRGVLSRWGARGGVEVLFLTDRRYRLHEARVFEGSFAAAAHSLFASLTHLPHAPVGEPRPDGRTLAVLHRAHPVGGGQ